MAKEQNLPLNPMKISGLCVPCAASSMSRSSTCHFARKRRGGHPGVMPAGRGCGGLSGAEGLHSDQAGGRHVRGGEADRVRIVGSRPLWREEIVTGGNGGGRAAGFGAGDGTAADTGTPTMGPLRQELLRPSA